MVTGDGRVISHPQERVGAAERLGVVVQDATSHTTCKSSSSSSSSSLSLSTRTTARTGPPPPHGRAAGAGCVNANVIVPVPPRAPPRVWAVFKPRDVLCQMEPAPFVKH